MWPLALLLIYGVIAAAASLLGGYLPSLLRVGHTLWQLMMSLVAGLMLGVGLLHMLPHATAYISLTEATQWAIVGVLTMFLMIRVLHVHQHGPVEKALEHEHAHEHEHHHDHASHGHEHGHAHHHAHSHGVRQHPSEGALKSQFSWMGLAVGLSLHSLIDGMAMAASVRADADHSPQPWLLGIAAFLAVAFHKPLDSLAITSLMSAGGASRAAIVWVNLGFALICPLGAALFYMGFDMSGGAQDPIVGGAMAFSAGVFLCLSLADILPEVSFHSHDRGLLTGALLLGAALAFLIGFLEPQHIHAR